MSGLPLLPSGHTSVMASRAATAPDDLDYFPTPPWAARAGGELLQKLDPGRWTCWEPACGEGHMATGLYDYFPIVYQSDIFPYAKAGADGEILWQVNAFDFLSDGAPRYSDVDWIVTNPPFKLGEAFVRQALKHARRGVAMLLRLAFLEGVARHKLLYEDHPLSVLAPFAERVPMVKGKWDPDASSATAYAWFIWLKPEVSRCPRVVPIAPGAKVRLHRADDLVRFGLQVSAPLLEGAG